MKNKVVRLTKRPNGFPSKETWSNSTDEVREIEKDEILVKNLYVSLDPAMRGWLNETRSYIPPVKIGEVMRAGTIGEVIKSKNSKFNEGDILSGWVECSSIQFLMEKDISKFQQVKYHYQLT